MQQLTTIITALAKTLFTIIMINNEWMNYSIMNEWGIYIVLSYVLLYTQSTLHLCQGSLLNHHLNLKPSKHIGLTFEKSKRLSDNIANVKCLVKGTLVIAYEFECAVFWLPAWIFNHWTDQSIRFFDVFNGQCLMAVCRSFLIILWPQGQGL